MAAGTGRRRRGRLARAAALLAVGSGAEGPGPEGRWRPVFWEPVPFHRRPGHGEAAGRFGGEPRGARLEERERAVEAEEEGIREAEAHCDEWERSLAERTQQLRERAEAFRAQWDDQMIAFFHFIVFRLVSIQDAAAAAAPETPRPPGAAPRGAPGARPQAAGWSEVEVLVCVPGPLDSAASGFPVHKILWTSSGLSLVNVCERAAVVGQPEPLEALGMLATFLEQTRGQGQEPDGRLYLVVPWANAVFNALPAAAEAAEVVDRYERAAAEELGPGWAARGVAPPAVAAQEALQGGFGALAGPAEALAEVVGGMLALAGARAAVAPAAAEASSALPPAAALLRRFAAESPGRVVLDHGQLLFGSLAPRAPQGGPGCLARDGAKQCTTDSALDQAIEAFNAGWAVKGCSVRRTAGPEQLEELPVLWCGDGPAKWVYLLVVDGLSTSCPTVARLVLHYQPTDWLDRLFNTNHAVAPAGTIAARPDSGR